LLKQALQLRQSLADEFPEELKYQNDIASSLASLESSARIRQEADEANALLEREIHVRERLAKAEPSNEDYQWHLAFALKKRGRVHFDLGQFAQADKDLFKAVSIIANLDSDNESRDRQEALLLILRDRSRVLQKLGRQDESEMLLDKAITVATKLVSRRPDIPTYRLDAATVQRDRGLFYIRTKRFRDAENQFRRIAEDLSESATLLPSQAASFHLKIALASQDVGIVFALTDRWDEAEDAFRRATDICQKLANENPDTICYQAQLVSLQLDVGRLYLEHNRLDAAEPRLQTGLVLAKRYAERFPNHHEVRTLMAAGHSDMARGYLARGNATDAETAYAAALSIYRSLSEAAPEHEVWAEQIASTQHSLTKVYRQNGRPAKAKEAILEAARIWTRLFGESDNPKHLDRKTWSFYSLGNHALEGGDLEEANRWFTRVIDERKTLPESALEDPSYRNGLKRAHAERAKLRANNGDINEAIEDWNAAMALADPNRRDFYLVERAMLQAANGAHEVATSEVREMAKRYPADHPSHVSVAKVYAQAAKSVAQDNSMSDKERSEAVETFRREAMQMLKQSLRAGAFRIPATREVLDDSGFDLLRSHDEFISLLEAISDIDESADDDLIPDGTGH